MASIGEIPVGGVPDVRLVFPVVRMCPTRLLAILPSLCALAACQSYEAEPLDGAAVLAELRDEGRGLRPLTLERAVDQLLRRNPRVVAAIGAWQQAAARASVATPFANPTMSLGPVFLSSGAPRWGFESVVGWLLPWTGTQGLQDEINQATAAAAQTRAIATAREEYLALRQDLLLLVLERARLATERKRLALLEQLVTRQRALGADATMSALEIEFTELERETQISAVGAREARCVRLQGQLAVRCGVGYRQLDDLQATAAPDAPDVLPDPEELAELLLQHPQAIRLASSYEVAEANLRLAVRRQYPDLQISGTMERERNANRFSLPLGITVPWSGNRGPIAVGRSQRQSLRSQHTAVLRQQRSALLAAHREVAVQTARFAGMQTAVESLSTRVRDLIRASLQAGRLNALSYVQALRRVHNAELARIDAQADLLQSWLRLEQACGAPLLTIPGQPTPPSQLPTPTEGR